MNGAVTAAIVMHSGNWFQIQLLFEQDTVSSPPSFDLYPCGQDVLYVEPVPSGVRMTFGGRALYEQPRSITIELECS